MLNNIDKEKKTINWYLPLKSGRDRTHTHSESRFTQTLKKLWKELKPIHSTKGNSKYHN